MTNFYQHIVIALCIMNEPDKLSYILTCKQAKLQPIANLWLGALASAFDTIA